MTLPALDLSEPDHKFKLGPFVCGIDSHWLDAIHRPGQTIEKDPTLEDLRLILIYLPSRKVWRPLWSVSIVEPDDDHRYLISDDATNNAIEELRPRSQSKPNYDGQLTAVQRFIDMAKRIQRLAKQQNAMVDKLLNLPDPATHGITLPDGKIMLTDHDIFTQGKHIYDDNTYPSLWWFNNGIYSMLVDKPAHEIAVPLIHYTAPDPNHIHAYYIPADSTTERTYLCNTEISAIYSKPIDSYVLYVKPKHPSQHAKLIEHDWFAMPIDAETAQLVPIMQELANMLTDLVTITHKYEYSHSFKTLNWGCNIKEAPKKLPVNYN